MNKGLFFQCFATVAGNLMAISDGMTVGWTSPMVPYFLSNRTHVKMTVHEAEWLETWYPIGSTIGLPFTVFFLDKIGRKNSLLLGTATMLIHWTILLTSKNVIVLYVARVLAGMAGDMSFVAAPSYISEIAHKNIRGFLSSIIFLLQLVGILTIYAIGAYLPFYAAPSVGIGLLLLELILFIPMPETPYYLMSKDRREEAKKSLTRFRDGDNVDVELEEISASIKRQQLEKGKITDIFSKRSYRSSLLIVIILNAAQQFGGINVILMNLQIILEEADSVLLKPSTAAVVFSGVMLVAAVFGSIMVDKFGRKKLLIVSSFLTILCLLSFAVYFTIKNLGYDYRQFSWLPVVSIMMYAFIFKIGIGMVPIVITAEIFPSKIKAFGMSLGDAVYTCTAIIMIQVFNSVRYHGMEYPFYLFVGCSIITTILVVIFVPETKGKSLDEIQVILEGKSKSEKEYCY